MFLALPIIALLALLLLGGLAAAVYGIVYAIVNKRPGVALGSVVAPVAAFFAVALMAVLYLRSQTVVHVAEIEPAQVQWAAQPSMPAMPAMPPIPPMPKIVEESHWLALGPFVSWRSLLLVVLIGATLYSTFSGKGKRRSCDGPKRFSWGKAIVGIVLALLIFNVFALSTVSILPEERVAWEPADVVGTVDEHARSARDQAQLQIAEAQRMADEAGEMAAAARNDGKNFQEMLEKLNMPRIKLDTSAKVTKLSVETETSPAAEISTADGETRFVVPISDETQQSLARSAAHLEQMVERVSEMAEQVSDAGTLLGRAMVALNERIDSRSTSELTMDIGATEDAVPRAEANPVAETKLATKLVAESNGIEFDGPAATEINIQIDPAKLRETGLTYEKLRNTLSRDGLWKGAVVRFDSEGSRIWVKGKFDERYVTNLENTLVDSEGWQHKPIRLADLAVVSTTGELRTVESAASSPPTWLNSSPKRVGNVWREVVESGEYATVEECYKAADIYLLLATHNHLSQLTGGTLQVSGSWRPTSLIFRDDQVVADGKVIISGNWIADDRLRRLSSLGIGVDFVRRGIANEEYVATTERSFGPMKNLYTQVEFTPSIDAELIRRWNDYQREERFAIVGAGASAVMGGIGVLFGLLKVDTWTKGYYTKRLFLGVPAAIIGVLALLGLAAG